MQKRQSKHKGKSALAEKLCPVCQRAFSWRKKWQRDWQNVIYCSKRCAKNKITKEPKPCE
ncbi:DUF2256 domain-containing protein [Paraglaciecola aquimarina]|uniref:DUF2256 domain-containing protein n=1 Tax=Paraglaciecola algarum TaxID=3050085 RepID=A0ABS9D118_9ALTE|nr:DUF2256 domain-containing protein [Paraglaciecola sp. G1-23]MCF2946621.1 DUF2256 domain-containing protein [Paraglaciecola sp. G1-23]